MRKIHPGKWAGSARRRAAPALKSASEAADTTIMGKPGGLVASSVGDAVQERRRLEGRWMRALPGLGVFCLLRGSPTAGCVTL